MHAVLHKLSPLLDLLLLCAAVNVTTWRTIQYNGSVLFTRGTDVYVAPVYDQANTDFVVGGCTVTCPKGHAYNKYTHWVAQC